MVELPAPLNGLSNEDVGDASERLRVCIEAQDARATGNWWAVHVRAIARVVWARAGIVDAWWEADGGGSKRAVGWG